MPRPTMGYLVITASLAILALAWTSAAEPGEDILYKEHKDEVVYVDSTDGSVYEEKEWLNKGDSWSPVSKMIRRKRSITPDDFELKIHLVSFHAADGSRVKRATYNTISGTWPLNIPYNFVPEFPQEQRQKIKSVMQEIMNNVCVKWIEEPAFDVFNNTYDTDAYLSILYSTTNICSAKLGRGGSDRGARTLRPCKQFASIAHELIHTLGTVHEMQGPLAESHMSINKDNVISSYFGGTYNLHDPNKMLTKVFDPSSIMMYSRRLFSNNGRDVMFPYREDSFNLEGNNFASVYAELNEVYKCKDSCLVQRECGEGYFSKVNGVCKCVCPDGLDPKTDCQSLDDETSGPDDWPDSRFNLYAASETNGVADCPEGFSPALFIIEGNGNVRFYVTAFFRDGKKALYYMCARTTSTPIYSMSSFPMGEYCVVKQNNQPCDSGFEEGGYVVNSNYNFTTEGDYGDWPIVDNTVSMKYCCRDDMSDDLRPIEFPRKKGFRFISNKGSSCAWVKGMAHNYGRVLMFVADSTVFGNEPKMWKTSSYLVHNFCTYYPPEYDCNMQVVFNKTSGLRKVDISTPGFNEMRYNNKRCLYHFSVAEGGRLKFTLDTYDAAGDQFNIRRFNKWALPYTAYDGTPRQFFSEGNFLFLEYWSSLASSATANNMGVKFSVEAMFDDENCYEVDNRGAEYTGDKSVSEVYEECLPWKDATVCADFPWDGLKPLELLTAGNKCRNPGGTMLGPWCYVSVDRGNCRRAYCDACNELDPPEDRADCFSLMAFDPSFCTHGLQRLECSNACGMNINPPVPDLNATTCSAPIVPDDAIVSEALKSGYYAGEKVTLLCETWPTLESIDIQCNADGLWPVIDHVCSDCSEGAYAYGDRCVTYDETLVFVADAVANCEAQNGQLFKIKSEADWNWLRQLKQGDLAATSGGNWVNMEYANGGWKLYTDNAVDAPYMNFRDGEDISGDVNKCVVMNYESDSTNPGKFLTVPCSTALSRTFCEITRVEDLACEDKSSLCADTLASYPTYCTKAAISAATFCAKSCGLCPNGNSNAMCSEETVISAHRVLQPGETSQSPVGVGEVMYYECNSGFFLSSGNLERACGLDGYLIGAMPHCSFLSNPLDVGISSIQYKRDVLPANKLYLIDNDEYRVPMYGQISHWHYFAVETGTIQFVVYRPNGTHYLLVGSNTVLINDIGRPWTYPISGWDRVTAYSGDVVGVLSGSGQIAAIDCTSSSYTEKFMNLFVESTTVPSSSFSSNGTNECWIPSFGYTIV